MKKRGAHKVGAALFLCYSFFMKKGFDYTGIVVMNLCHNQAGEYVLGFRSDKCRDEHFTWEPLGSGGLEFGESVADAIAREVKEEAGADVLSTEFVGYFEAFREIDGRPTHWLYIIHKVLVDQTQVVIGEPEKCLKLTWCTLDNFPNPLMSQFYPIIDAFRGKL